MSAQSRNMDVQDRSPFADQTAPLLPPEILSSFEALSEGRCSLTELHASVLEACGSDPEAGDRVLLLLEGYANSGEFERFDFRPLQRALERRQSIRGQGPEVDADGQQDSDAEPAHLSTFDTDPTACSSPSVRDADVDEITGNGFTENVDYCADSTEVARPAEPRILRGRYVLEAEIGRGGGGTVYRALDLNRTGLPGKDHRVALKVLHEQAARSPGAVDALRREYHQAQLLTHPGIVNVFDFDHDSGTYFVTMELLDGESLGTLTRRLQPNTVPLEAAICILRELGDAVAYAHDRGVLHLDLKPDNVMIDAEGHVRVLDFGLARTHTAEPWTAGMHATPAAATLAYASCERLVQERPDVRDDIFSFSCIAYELLAGKHPFDRYSALRARKEGRAAQRIRSLSRRQWNGLRSGLAWVRENRPPSMRALLQGLALESSSRSSTALRRVLWPAAAAVALLALFTVAISSWDRIENRMAERAEQRASAARPSAVSPVDTTTTQAPALVTLDRSSDETGDATPVHAKSVSEPEAGDANRITAEALVATTAPAEDRSAIAIPSPPDTTLEIEPATAVAEPESLPADAPVEAAASSTAPPRTPVEAAASSTAPPRTPVEATALSSAPTRSPVEASATGAVPTRSASGSQHVVTGGRAPSSAPGSTHGPLDVVGFSRHSFSVTEADSLARVNVRRIGDATGEIAFRWYTVDDSATAGRDYVYGSGDVLMAPGQTTATFVVPIVADSIPEDPELVQMVIGYSLGARVGPAGRAPLIIVDDD